ncbi:MAG: hypothetical protein GXP55_17305 [Deltaproteobacteria bacterium]|nr:hypothetical protein [Deltaproteobacteria bacterium]
MRRLWARLRTIVEGALWLSLLPLGACGSPAVGAPAITTQVDDWRDEVIYQVLTDRFANGDPSNDEVDGVGVMPGDLSRYQGGDFDGLRQHLGYIARLGATAIWISPVTAPIERETQADGYHGYWPADLTRTNPHFGDLEALRRLVRAAHRRDLKVIVDIVPNHMGRVFDYDLNRDGVAEEDEAEPAFSLAAPYDAPLLWRVPAPLIFTSDGSTRALGVQDFHRRGRGDLSDPAQRRLGDFPDGLRDLATERPELRDDLVATYARWVMDTNVDGFRIDAVPHIERAFWPAFSSALRERIEALGKQRFLLLGEVFEADPRRIAPFTEDGGLDSFFDLPLKLSLFDGVLLDGAPPETARFALSEARTLFPTSGATRGIGVDPWRARAVLADNHDTWRFAGELADARVTRLAMTLLFTLDGFPSVYYGTEQGFRGQGGHESREVMWTSGYDEGAPLYQMIAHLAQIRRESAALRRGELVVRYLAETGGLATAEDSGLLAYERVLDPERVLVVINAHALQSSGAVIPTGFPAGATLVDALEGERRFVVAEGGDVRLTLSPRSAVVLRR